MDKPAVIKAEFTDYRPIKTRKVLQLVFEVPAESQGEVFKALGYPIMGSSLWVAIARLAEPLPSGAPAPERSEPVADKARTPFRELPRGKQAVLKCKDADFQGWLRREYPDSWSAGRVSTDGDDEAVSAWIIKAMCGLASRGDLSKDEFPAAHATWDQLLTDYDMRNYTR